MAAASSSQALPIKQLALQDADPEIYDLLQKEQTRQFKGLELIASEVRNLFSMLDIFYYFCGYLIQF